MRLIAATLLIISSVCLLHAQGQGGSGDIRGFVLDANGSGISGAHVTVTGVKRGLTRSVESGVNGEYWVSLLPSGTYTVKVESAGFISKVVDSVEVRVGDIVGLQVRLDAGMVTSQVFVTAEIPAVDTQRTQQSTMIDAQRLQNLPINRRTYLDFALLAPGVVETNDLVDGSDFRVVQTPTSGLSFGGGNGRGNTVLIDGVENFSDSGGVRPGVSQDAVQEFQINRNSFGAEFGGSYGGSINIVTKSGTNDWHGILFGYLRHRALDARNYFDPTKSDYMRGQEGVSVGGPVKRDKTFFFTSFERLDKAETAFVPALWDGSLGALTPSQNQLLGYLDTNPQLKPLSTKLRAALLTQNYPATLQLFVSNTGAFPFNGNNTQLTERLDQQWSGRNTSFFRVSYSRWRDQNAQFGALLGMNRGRAVQQDDVTSVANHIFIPAPGWVTETRAQFAHYTFGVTPNDPNGPEINIAGFGLFGREIFQPFQVAEQHFQLRRT